jgi:cytochrome o ubiquinol oxidase subunit IV
MDNNAHTETHKPISSYVIGFLLSIFLTLGAFFLVQEKLLPPSQLLFLIISLGILQVIVQLFFFLHLGDEKKPYWNLVSFAFMVLVVVILVIGSIWIISNLNYNTMTPMKMSS